MKVPYIETSLDENGELQAFFAFQVTPQKNEDWKKMKWGFNAGALLEEALDRFKLFIEAQTLNLSLKRLDTLFLEQSLALRVINFPKKGVQTALIGKVSSQEATEKEIKTAGESFAREIQATFPYDFILKPAISKAEFHSLFGQDLFTQNVNLAQIQRGSLCVLNSQYMPALWQASLRSSEQIWRSISAMPKKILFNITIKPIFIDDNDKVFFLKQKKLLSSTKEEIIYSTLAENITKKYLEADEKCFLLQVHLLAEGPVDQNLLRTIGTSLTRDTSSTKLPGYRVIPYYLSDDSDDLCTKLLQMDLLSLSPRRENLADLEETYAVFRLPYPPASGLPGVNFIGLD